MVTDPGGCSSPRRGYDPLATWPEFLGVSRALGIDPLDIFVIIIRSTGW
jgi:hypothetical protein